MRIALAVTVAWATGVWVYHEAFQGGSFYLDEQLPTMFLPPAFVGLCVALCLWVWRSASIPRLFPQDVQGERKLLPSDVEGQRKLLQDGTLDAAKVLLFLENRALQIHRSGGDAVQKAALIASCEKAIADVQRGHDILFSAAKILAARATPFGLGQFAKLQMERDRMADLLRIYADKDRH